MVSAVHRIECRMRRGLPVALACALAVPALFAAPSGSYVCYKPDEGQSVYPWDHAAKWFDTVNGGATINRVPTTNDYVFLYSNKNDVGANGKPMVVTNGVHAETGGLEICDKGNNPNNVIGITVQDGGTMTNAGIVKVGNSGSGKTGGGLLMVESGGAWTANDVFNLGWSSGTSLLNVKEGGSFACSSEFIVGRQYGYGIVTNEGSMSIYDFFVGGSGSGVFVNKGELSVSQKLTIGRWGGSFGHLILEKGGALRKQSGREILIANSNTSVGILECSDDLTIGGSGNSGNIVIAPAASVGRLVINEGAVVSNVTYLFVGTVPGAQGYVDLRGGTLKIHGHGSAWKVFLGESGTNTTGRITGWGAIRNLSNKLRIMMFGQVIADGGGVERDLDLSHFRTVGTNATVDISNVCGTNGWYAANRGRLIYPRTQDCTANKASHPTIGDYPSRTTPYLVNSFTYSLGTKPDATYYNFAELYARDRTDIPAGLPLCSSRDVVAGVWRFGLSSASGTSAAPTPIGFGGMRLTFRYDWREMREGQTVYVYRHDGSAGGSWTRVGKAELSSIDNVITTDKFDASSETWNAGWFAVVAQNPGGAVIVIRYSNF